jgi:hypothetical protein
MLERHISQKPFIGETWALVNHELGVYHFDDPQAVRTGILIHVANHQWQLEGCIGIGDKYGSVGSYNDLKWGVWNSTKSMAKLRSILGDGAHFLDIRSY